MVHKGLVATDQIVPTHENAVTARNKILPLLGIANLCYEFKDSFGRPQKLTVPSRVVEDLVRPVLLGRDFIHKAAIRTDGHTQTYFVGARDGLLVADRFAPTGVDRGRVSAFITDDLTIPARSTVLATARVLPPHYDGLIGCVSMSVENNICSVQTLAQVRNGEVTIPVTNYGAKEEHLACGMDIGSFDELEGPTEMATVFMEQTVQTSLKGGPIHVGAELSLSQQADLLSVVQQFEHVLSFAGQLGECTTVAHEINTGTSHPVTSGPRRQSPAIRAQAQKQITEWLACGAIRPSNSPWSSQIVMVQKKDKTLRLCIDYRPLNKITIKDAYPLPTLDEILTALDGSMYYSSLDLNQGYLQIRMAEKDIPKTAFAVAGGLYEFTRMPFGLTNAPATFQRCMDNILNDLKYTSCLVYLDDIIIFGKTLEEHNHHLGEVLGRIAEAGMTIKPSKCAFAVLKLRFLGHVISSEGLEMDPEKVQAIKSLPVPTCVRDIQSFIGMASYYRRFIQNFARIAEPLTRLTKKAVPFEWSTDQQQAYSMLKEALMKQPVLCHYNPGLQLELRTDACGYGLGAILLQIYPDKTKKVVCYLSRLLQKAERNYCITEKECLAIVWAIRKCKQYLQGSKFVVVTDHIALKWLKEKTDLEGRLMRWALFLADYDYEIVYRSGKQHKDADHLSRFPGIVAGVQAGRRGTFQGRPADHGPTTLEVESSERDGPRELDLNNLIDMQQKDGFCLKVLAEKRSEFMIKDGLLSKRPTKEEELVAHGPVIVVPEVLLDDVLYSIHDSPTAAHGGFKKTLNRFRQRYYIPNAAKRVKHYVVSCTKCQLKKPPWTKKYGLLTPLTQTTKPFERIGIDTIGPLRPTESGNIKCIVVTDYLTRWAIARAVPSERDEEVADFLIREVYLRFGAPEEILSDRGTNFSTKLMRSVYEEFQSKHIKTTSYRPQTNGLTERFNRTLNTMLSMYVNKNHNDWDEHLPYVVYAYNTSIQASTGFSPFYLLHGFHSRTPSDLQNPNSEDDLGTRLQLLDDARGAAVVASISAKEAQKKQYDKGRYTKVYQPGDKVYLHWVQGRAGQSNRFRNNYVGPMEVLSRSDDTYWLKNLNRTGNRPAVEAAHVSRLKPCVLRKPDSENK